MKKAILMAVCFAACSMQIGFAQVNNDSLSTGELFRGMSRAVPTGRVVIPYGLEVTFEKTVHLIFPAPIRYVDLGSANIIAGQAEDAENVLGSKLLSVSLKLKQILRSYVMTEVFIPIM